MSVLSGAYYAFTTDNDRNDKKEKLLKKEFLFRKIAFVLIKMCIFVFCNSFIRFYLVIIFA